MLRSHIPRIGVFEVDLIPVLRILADSIPDLTWVIEGEEIQARSIMALARCAARAPAISGRWSYGGHTGRLDIECYRAVSSTLWVSSNRDNADLRVIDVDNVKPLTAPGINDVTDILDGLPMNSYSSPIDVVITWVNHADPEWQSLYKLALSGGDEFSSDATAPSRFQSFDELRFCLRSIRQNADWVRNIFIVTNCSRPDWLQDHSRIHWVNHSDIIDEEYLPTFNSHAIESCIHLISGLSDTFIYLNDDFFVSSPVTPDDFVHANGVTKFFPESSGVVSGENSKRSHDHLNASRNSARIIQRLFGYYPTRILKHAPYVINKNVMTELIGIIGPEVDQTRRSKFRSISDVNVPSFLYHYYAFYTRSSVPEDIQYMYVSNQDVFWRDALDRLDVPSIKALCINSGGTNQPNATFYQSASEKLEQLFPQAPEWERFR